MNGIIEGKKNAVLEKSFDFALKIVKLYKYLKDVQKEFILSKQLLRAGTSVGANVREAQNAESSGDFIHKLGIAQKEADETRYWLELLHKSEYLSDKEATSILADATELIKIIRTIIITIKQKRNN